MTRTIPRQSLDGEDKYWESGWWRRKLCSPIRGWQFPSPNRMESVSARGSRARTTKTVLNALSISGSRRLVILLPIVTCSVPKPRNGAPLHKLPFNFRPSSGDSSQCTPIKSVFSTREVAQRDNGEEAPMSLHLPFHKYG